MAEDNWEHRAANMRCRTCMYYCKKTGKNKDMHTDDAGVDVEVGRCRRHAPTMSGWPVMFPTDWCGDHKLNENSL